MCACPTAATLRSEDEARLLSSGLRIFLADSASLVSSLNAIIALSMVLMILARRIDFSSSVSIRPYNILASKYRSQISFLKIPITIFSTLASNEPCLFGLSCSGSGSRYIPNSELAAASTQSSTSFLLIQLFGSITRVLTKLGSQIDAFVIPCISLPFGS